MCPSVPPTCAHQCHPPVPISAAQQCCHSVPPVSAQRFCQSVPSSCASQYLAVPPSVPPISAVYQGHLSVPPICDTSLVLPISAAYQCPSVPPISAHQCCLINAHQ
ncbi:unnamed protein product [Staurois parvus]|uniref:Uncharacterized protein n=1 Tax=Staurois parvus TaxID=386267 RepID=A0ABN9H0K1_9NEOB|nr:unnamed protein product [Staurois parvus]